MMSRAGQDLLDRVTDFLGDALADVDRIFHNELRSWHPGVGDIVAHVTKIRGKRLRPLLLLLSADACGGIRSEHKVLAAVVEMIHTATLVHDDVLDEALTRRHMATVNGRWSNETSVLFGDFLFTHAFHLASQLESTQACRLIGRATNLVCEGELLQVYERGNCDLDEATYLRIIEGKTGELCAVCCRLGAVYAQADEQTALALDSYGRHLGMAFQIVDDILDLLGDEREMGKSLGSDLRKGKMTLPLIRLLAELDEAERESVRAMLMRPDSLSAAQLVPYLERSDCIRYARDRALEFTTTARNQLAHLPDTTGRRLLEQLSGFVIERTF